MLQAESIQRILPGVFRWEIFSAEHKVALCSHAIVVSGRLICFDPVPLADAPFDELSRQGGPSAIVLTNENHERDCALWRDSWRVPIWADATASLTIAGVQRFERHQSQWQDWQLHRLVGGAGGEIALQQPSDSLVVCGDAIVNLPTRGLELLPDKYCRDPASLRNSLRKLVSQPFDRLMLAHGTSVLENASDRVAALLG
ncbi:MAG: hypothetical protein ABI651_06180 [Verrucomicrobiota bacterium]